MAYQPKTYRDTNGDRIVVASGGSIEVETGGDITVNGASLIDEIAALSGLDTGELGVLNGAAAGVATASKAAIYDAAGKLYRSSASPAAAGTLISDATALTAELNAVTGANGTAGVKLPVAAADEVVTVINTNASNNLLVYPVSGSQINALGASNAFTLTPGQTATFVGRSATLWYTAAATDTVAGLTASAAELNFNDTSLAGTSVASKTLVLGASKNTDILGLPVGGLKIGAAGAEVAIDADAAELNVLNGAVAANSAASKAALLDASKQLQTNANNGTPEATVTAVHYGDGVNVTAVLTLTNTVLAVGTSENLGVGALIYTLPAGACLIRDAYMSVAFSGVSTANDTPEIGLGTVIASGAVTQLSGTATFENIVTGQVAADTNGTATVKGAAPTAGGALEIATGAAHTVHVNMADGWGANADQSGLLNGTVVLSYIRQAA
jgi:hypothetical protein